MISVERVKMPIKWQYKRNTGYSQIFLRVDFTESQSGRGGELLADELDSLIKHKSFTVISQLNTTDDLDENYGAVKTRKAIGLLHYVILLLFLNKII